MLSIKLISNQQILKFHFTPKNINVINDIQFDGHHLSKNEL